MSYGSSLCCDPLSTAAHCVLRVPALGAAAILCCGAYFFVPITPKHPNCTNGVVKEVVMRDGVARPACVWKKRP